MMISS